MLAVLVGVCFFLTNLYLWLRFHIHIPMQDTWRQLPLVQNVLEHGFWSTTLEDWLAPHAGAHRITITRLLMVVDYRYFGGQNHAIYASAWLSIMTILLVYVSAFRKSYRSETALLVFVAGLALIFLSCHTQLWNLINPINNSWYVALGASVLGIWLIVKRSAPPTFLCFTTTYLLAIVAALSNFSGVIVWLLLPLFIALRSARVGLVATLFSGVFLALYLQGISPDSAALLKDPNFIEQLKNSSVEHLTFFEYWLKRGTAVLTKTCMYLGSPLSIDHPRLANLTVVISFAVIIAGWLKLAMHRFLTQHQHNTWFELTLAMATLCLGVAIATQMGRVMLSSPTADRYQTVVMLYWLSVCGLVLFFGLRAGEAKPLWQPAATALCLGIAALLLVNSPGTILRSSKVAEAANRASVLGMLNVSDITVHLGLLPRNRRDYFVEFKAFFKRNKVAHRANTTRLIDFETSIECPAVDLRITPSKWPGISIATGSVDDHWTKWHRQIPLSTKQGNVIGHLFPVYGNKPSIESLLIQRKGRWEGYFGTPVNSNDAVYMHYRSSPFAKRSCRIAV